MTPRRPAFKLAWYHFGVTGPHEGWGWFRNAFPAADGDDPEDLFPAVFDRLNGGCQVGYDGQPYWRVYATEAAAMAAFAAVEAR